VKRYFEFVGQKEVVEFNITDGSPASKASPKEFGDHFNCDMREIDKSEYDRLSKEYTK
jgi:hypothetical protein